ncbi:MAG TPA: apolipoprotein N-acyltransferase, partial [Burkholderiaceae bacterium]
TRRAEARAWAPLALPAALLLGGLALPQDFTRSTGTISVSLLQTNVAQDVKFEDAEVRKALAWHVQALAQAPGQLVVTPESSLPIPAGDIPRDVWQAYEKPFAVPGRAALVGVFTGDDHVGYTNSVVGLDALQRESDGTAFHYGKRHLLPFGEFVPPGFQWMLDMMKVPIGSQARGTETGSLAVAGQRVRTMICYEDLFGDELAASMVGPGAATLMANVSNLAWFGTLEVQDQHLQFSRMRALEFQRGQVRATNTGATAVIDWHGRVTDRLPPAVEGRLDARVEGRIGDTPYARWVSEWHLWPLWWLGGFLLLAGAMLRRR